MNLSIHMGTIRTFLKFPLIRIRLFGFCLCLSSSMVWAEDLTELPLEDLLAIEVVTASKIARQISDSPSAVSIVTAEDIRSYGYKTLAEVINSMRGLNTVSDHLYTYMSGRSFGRPGDYPGRVMLLIDGHQANDNLYNASYLGNDGYLDTELIERVEYVSGPGAASYGNGAFYGIINIVTKKGSDFNGAQLSLDAGRHDSYKQRVSYGNALDNGAEFLVSASTYRSNGRDLYFPEFDSPATNSGIAEDLNQERNLRLFFKGSYEQWSLQTAYVTRNTNDPASSYEADFNTPSKYEDTNGYINLLYEDDISQHLKQALKIYYGQYNYSGKAFYAGDFYSEKNVGRWWGTEAKFVYSGFDQHRLVYGVEYRNDYQQDFYLPSGHAEHSNFIASLYLQDEYQWTDSLAFNIGMRGDYGGRGAKNISPRLAVIYTPTSYLDIKASYASAFRRPNAYEKYYNDGNTILGNPELHKEMVYASELVMEFRPDSASKFMGSLFHYQTEDFISSIDSPLVASAQEFINMDTSRTRGFDIEYARQWSRSSRLKASYAWQYATDDNGRWIANSPKNLAKLNIAHGFFDNHLHTGFELQYVGSRKTEEGDTLGGYTVTNLTFHNTSLIQNGMISLSIRNLFNRDYAVPAPVFYRPDRFAQQTRNVWLQLSYDFK